jgi:hypothetical protein
MSKKVHLISILFQIPLSIFIIILTDIIHHDSINPIKTSILLLIIGAIIILIVDEETIVEHTYPNGSNIFLTAGLKATFVFLLFYFNINFSILYLGIRIFLKSPAQLKRKALGFLITGLLIGVGTPVINFLDLGENMSIAMMSIFSIGIGLFTYAFISEPKLAFILPYKVKTLIILDTKSGMPYFTHTWGIKTKETAHTTEINQELIQKEMVRDETLSTRHEKQEEREDDGQEEMPVSSVLYGVSTVLKEAVKSGDVFRIDMENGTILIERINKVNLAAVLIVSKPSYSVRNALRNFIGLFYAKFKHVIPKVDQPSLFYEAKEIITECFSFLPE